jgi:hypothetical protein
MMRLPTHHSKYLLPGNMQRQADLRVAVKFWGAESGFFRA